MFAEGTASLDARVDEHDDIKDLIVSQLRSLLRHLKRMKTYHTSDGDEEEIIAAEHVYDPASSSARSESTFSTITSIVTPSETSNLKLRSIEDAEKPEEQEGPPLAATIHAINRLHRVGMALRKSGLSSHNVKATKEVFKDEYGRNVIDVFREWCLRILSLKFKTASPAILERIAHANAERRRIFLYRRKHQKKLMGRRESAPSETRDTAPLTLRLHESYAASNIVNGVDPMGRSSTRSIAEQSLALSRTTASRVIREDYHYAATMISTVVSAAPSTQIPISSHICPPAPKVATGAQEFFCPYCCRVHPASERSGKKWRNHFLKDLSPFICLAEHCHEPYKMYSDQQTWMKHMESHSVKYTCKQHQKPVHFLTETEFDEHILTEHRRINRQHLARLRSFNRASTKLDICSCPICGFQPTKAPVAGMSVANHEAAYKELFAHIAYDLQFIANWSLDESDEADVSISSNASDDRVPDESTQAADLESTSLDQEIRKGSIEDWPEEHYIPNLEDQVPEQTLPEGADPADEWILVRRARSSSYTGPELDPKLENFVRRLQLERLLQEGKTADPQLPCYILPYTHGKDFYGRQGKLQHLERNLHPAVASRSLRTMTLTGPAGIGKTRLAMEYCLNYQNQYDVVLWCHADQESKLASDFVKIATALGFVGRDSAESRDQNHCRQLVKAWLANPLKTAADPEESETASWLLVLDHIIDPDTVKDYWPTDCKSGSILITSRKPMPWSFTYYPKMEVEPFDSEDSAAFLSRLIKADDAEVEAVMLGSRAVYSPTQLTFLASMITHERYSLDKFLQKSRGDDGKKVILSLHTEDATQNQANFADWALESLSPKAAAMLDVMAMMDPDHIIERMLMLPPDSISIPAYPKNLDDYYEARAELSSYSFISKNRYNGTLNIHRTIQDAARRHMTEQYYRDVFNTCVALINDDWPYQPFTWRHSVGRWKSCEDLYSHIVRLRQFSARVPPREDDVNGGYGFARLATDVAWYCHERGLSEEVLSSLGLFEYRANKTAVGRVLRDCPPGLQYIERLFGKGSRQK